MTLLDAIPVGRQNARTKRELAAAMGMSTRAVEAEIEALRKDGKAPICSDSQVGYWRPQTVDELEQNVDRRRARAINQLTTCRGERRLIRKWRARLVDQQTLGLVA